MSARVDPNEVWARLGVAGRVALAVAVLALLAIGMTLPGLVRAVFAPSADAQASAKGDVDANKAYADSFGGYLGQIDGRIVFLTPGPPVQEKPPVSAPSDVIAETPPAPSKYEGPGMVGMMSDTVWFDNGKRLRAGGDREGDLRVVSINPPWDASLEWKGVTFTVPFLGRDALVIKPAPMPEPKQEEPSEEATKPNVASIAAATVPSVPTPAPPPSAEAPVAAAPPPAVPAKADVGEQHKD